VSLDPLLVGLALLLVPALMTLMASTSTPVEELNNANAAGSKVKAHSRASQHTSSSSKAAAAAAAAARGKVVKGGGGRARGSGGNGHVSGGGGGGGGGGGSSSRWGCTS
jgi:hypothetical protein